MNMENSSIKQIKILVMNKLNNKNKLCRTAVLLAVVFLTSVSCNKIYDNVEEYVSGEIVYSDKLDGIIRIQTGYERVEIDLMKAGRIPSSQIKKGRAKKTVIECPDFTEPDHRRIIDSICSWVNITGLTQLKTYQFIIYTEDAYGNRSLELTAEARPYTAENLASIGLPDPDVYPYSPTAINVVYNNLSNSQMRYFGNIFEYIDKNSEKKESVFNESQSFIVDNIVFGKMLTVNVQYKIIPIINDVPILDTVWLKKTLTLDTNLRPVIMLQDNDVTINANNGFPVTLKWGLAGAASIQGYILKFSRSGLFPADVTLEIPLGMATSYDITEDFFNNELMNLSDKNFITDVPATSWTVIPVGADTEITSQINRIFLRHKTEPLSSLNSIITGFWDFEDADNPFKATTGKDLIFGKRQPSWSTILPCTDNVLTLVDGPHEGDKAVRVPQYYFFKAEHGISSNGTLVTEYSILWDVKFQGTQTYFSFYNTDLNCATDAHFFVVYPAGQIGKGVWGYSQNGIITVNKWYRVILTMNQTANRVTCYVNGYKIFNGSNVLNNAQFSLKLEGFLIFGDDNGNNATNTDAGKVVVFNRGLTDEEANSLGWPDSY
jgi:hypothetical protein